MSKEDGILKKTAIYFFNILSVISFVAFLLFYFDILPIVGIGFSTASAALVYAFVPWILLFSSVSWFVYRRISISIKKQKELLLKEPFTNTSETFEKIPYQKTWGRDLISWTIIFFFMLNVSFVLTPWLDKYLFRNIISLYMLALPFIFSAAWIVHKFCIAKLKAFPKGKLFYSDSVAFFSIIVPWLLVNVSSVVNPVLEKNLEMAFIYVALLYQYATLIFLPLFLFGIGWIVVRMIYVLMQRVIQKNKKSEIHLSFRYKPVSIWTIVLIAFVCPLLIVVEESIRSNTFENYAKKHNWSIYQYTIGKTFY